MSHKGQSIPRHRLFNPETGDHFYTTSVSERDNAVSVHGYRNEEIACYVFSDAGSTEQV